MTRTPSSYAELAGVLDALPMLIRETRRARGLSMRAAARESGIGYTVIHRIEAGHDCTRTNATLLLRWLDR